MPYCYIAGQFYEFDRNQPLGREIGALIPRKHAQVHLWNKKDVYTPKRSDAKSLAKAVQKGKADWEGSHDAGYYPHYHPAGNHDDYGHIFYGPRGYREGESRE